MKLIDAIRSLFDRKSESASYSWYNTGRDLIFSLPEKTPAFGETRAAYQHTVLQMLLEAGEAWVDKRGIHVDNDTLCRLDEASRVILDLPAPWPGSFELEALATTFSHDFSLTLNLLPERGMGRYPAELEGVFVLVEGTRYLPDAAQWQALAAVAAHSALSPAERTEATNLKAVYALQNAQDNGLAITLRKFDRVNVEEAERVGVSVLENEDGSVRLVPAFGLGLSPDEPELSPEAIEARLGQLEGKDDTAVLRVGKKLVLLNEERLKAVREILSSRVISARDKRLFFKSPGAFLDASLIDLDMGFALRVKGVTEFKKAYFGYSENDSQEWFEESGQEPPQIILLEDCLPLLENEAELDELQKQARVALAEPRWSVGFKEKTILLPSYEEELERSVAEVRKKLLKKLEKPGGAGGEEGGAKPAGQPPSQVVDILLNDIEADWGKTTRGRLPFPRYEGRLPTEKWHYTMKPYQEEGIRWLLWLIEDMLQRPKQEDSVTCGGLLADDMGLGKTFMVLAALGVYRELAQQVKRDKPVLVVMPVVLLENWKLEVDNVFKASPFEQGIVVLQRNADLQRFRLKGAGREIGAVAGPDGSQEGALRYSLKIGPAYGSNRLDLPGRLVLTNYDTLADYQFSLCQVDWGCVIFDEAQEIKNPNTIKARAAKGLKADFRLAVTGTPVENSLSDFWSLYDTVKPGLLSAFQDFRKRYISPIKAADPEERDETRQRLGKELRQRVGPFMLRRTKEDQLSGLPKKYLHDGREDARYCAVMGGEQLAAYNDVVAAVVAARQSGDGSRVHQVLLPSLQKLQRVSLHPALKENNGEPEPGANRHGAEAELKKSAKLELLLRILDEIRQRGEKAILFVITKSLQRFLAHALGMKYGLPISIINGDTKSVTGASGRGAESRVGLIKKFEEKEGFNVIIMSPLAAGVGLTVVGANNVIHLERHWNPAREAQATDRVYRIGQEKDVHVYIPVLKHPDKTSFDVNLGQLLVRKLDIRDAVVTTSEARPEDFDNIAIFGEDLRSDEPIHPDWLPAMDWRDFEALAALLAQKECGGQAYLTPQSGDHGADVVLVDVSGGRNMVIQCKTSKHAFGEGKGAAEVQSAGVEYGKRFGGQCRAVLAVNAPSVKQSVRDRAKGLDVEIWDRPVWEKLLKKHRTLYSELGELLAQPRLERL